MTTVASPVSTTRSSVPRTPRATSVPAWSTASLTSTSRSTHSRTAAARGKRSISTFQRSPTISLRTLATLSIASTPACRTMNVAGSAMTTVTISTATPAASDGQRTRAWIASCIGCAMTASTSAQVIGGTNGRTSFHTSQATTAVASASTTTSTRSRVSHPAWSAAVGATRCCMCLLQRKRRATSGPCHRGRSLLPWASVQYARRHCGEEQSGEHTGGSRCVAPRAIRGDRTRAPTVRSTFADGIVRGHAVRQHRLGRFARAFSAGLQRDGMDAR